MNCSIDRGADLSKKKKTSSANTIKKRSSALLKKWKKLIKAFTALGIFAIITLIADFAGIFGSKEAPVNIENHYQNTYQYNFYNQSVTEQPADLSQINALYNQGRSFFTQGAYDKAITSYKEALTGKNSVDVNTARIQYALGLAYKYNSNADEAITLYTQALGTLQSLLEASASADKTAIENEMKYVHYLLSAAYLEKKDFQRALDECNLCETVTKPDSLSADADYTFGPASVYNLRGQIYASSYYTSHSALLAMEEKDLGYTLDDALHSLEKAILEKNAQYAFRDSEDFAPDNVHVDAFVDWAFLYTLHPMYWLKKGVYILSQKDAEMAEILTNRASVLLMMGYYDFAIKDCEAALKIYEELPFHEKYNLYRTYLILSYAKLYSGFHEDGSIDDAAIADCHTYIRKGLEHTKAWYGENHFLTATAYENMGMADLLSRNYAEAIKNHREAKHIFKKLGLKEDAKKQTRFINKVKRIRAAGTGSFRVEAIPFNGYVEYGMYYQQD